MGWLGMQHYTSMYYTQLVAVHPPHNCMTRVRHPRKGRTAHTCCCVTCCCHPCCASQLDTWTAKYEAAEAASARAKQEAMGGDGWTVVVRSKVGDGMGALIGLMPAITSVHALPGSC